MMLVNHSLIPGVLIITESEPTERELDLLEKYYGSYKHIVRRRNLPHDAEAYVRAFNEMLIHVGLPPAQNAVERNESITKLLQLPHWLELNM